MFPFCIDTSTCRMFNITISQAKMGFKNSELDYSLFILT